MAADADRGLLSFENAIENFKTRSGLTSRELTEMQMTSLLDLQKALAEMQLKQQNSKTMRFLRRLQPFLDTMERYSKVINIFANASDIVAFIWGPMKFILVIASNFSEAFNAMLEGYLAIGESIPQLTQYQDLSGINQHIQSALTLIFGDILDFHLEAIKLFKQRSWRQLYHATWRSLRVKIDCITKSLRRHKELLHIQASLDNIRELKEFRQELQLDFKRSEKIEKDHQRSRIQRWLGAINTDIRHQNAVKERFPETGRWLLGNLLFRNWFSPDQCIDPLLWLHGIPGAGKTILASLIIDEARKIPDTTTIFFYCKHTDDQRNGFLTVAKSFLSQILTQQDLLTDYLSEEVSKSTEAILSTSVTAGELLKVALSSCKNVYIVLDGLDEYSRDDRKELTSWFQEMISSLPKTDFGSIRCLFVSQEDGAARKDLFNVSQVKMTSADNKADIEAFCEKWHEKIEDKFGRLERREHHVKNIVTARAQGMFLFAKLVTWNLYEQTSRFDFESELDQARLPDGLDQACVHQIKMVSDLQLTLHSYDRILQRLLGPASKSKSRADSVRMLLGWLACAKRPLKWYEIQGATAVDLENGIMSTKHQFREDCKDLCASLVEDGVDQTVTLVHSTTKGYLIRTEHITISHTECEMAIRSLVYLSMPDFDIEKSDPKIEQKVIQGTYAFVDYAVCFWAIHLECAAFELGDKEPERLQEVAESLESFLDMHWQNTDKLHRISDTLKKHLMALQHLDNYDRVCQAVAVAKSWLRPTAPAPTSDEVLRLPDRVAQIRHTLESIISSPSATSESRSLVMQYHGPNCYKCTRFNCQFFYRGFSTDEQRSAHISKHERAFTCRESGCPYYNIGFTKAKELERHVFDHHGIAMAPVELEFPDELQTESTPLELEFPDGLQTQSTPLEPEFPDELQTPLMPAEKTSRKRGKVQKVHRCNLCSKTFTRSHNLKSHMLTHNNERPHQCRLCGKRFARWNDLSRHEDLHSGEKRFICKGELRLQPGIEWGCGRRFTRAENLAAHYRSAVGKRCIKPLEEEEAADEGARKSSEEPSGEESHEGPVPKKMRQWEL